MRRFVALALLCSFPAAALAQGVHVDRKNGYQVKPPSGWTVVPLKVEEKWIVAKWLSDKKYIDKESGFEHQPLMRVILFPKSEAAAASGGNEGDKPVDVTPGMELDLSRPFTDYKDYLKRNFMDGGFYVSAENATKIGGIPVNMMEVKIEKLVMTGKKRIFAWEYEAEWGRIAIECDALEQHVEKVKVPIMNAFKTFGIIKRDPNAKNADEDEDFADGGKIRFRDPNETPEQQKERRIKAQEAMFKKAIAQLPKDWTHKRTPHFLILNHGSKDFIEKVVAHSEAVYKWLEQNFEDTGEGYVQHVIIRICANTDEERAFRKSSGDSISFESRELVLSQDTSFGKEAEFEYLGRNLMRFYFHDKNEELYEGMPNWLSSGLSNYIGTAKFKSGKLDFVPDSWEAEKMREGRRLNKFKPLRELFEMTSRELWAGEDGRYLDSETVSVVRYILGPGRANPKHGVIIRNYIAELLKILKEQELAARNEVKAGGEAKTEEEEEEEFRKKRKQNWDAKEKDLLQAVHKKVFEKWSDGDWAVLQSTWEKFAK